ncbi:alkaline phosphatase [Telluribacter sp.]|jgi:predicted AlkP superfamily pyrophosphatase or phosphodiesterase|uniref:alkaline phosphatase n=1 Tax=Telluribacter sp. TaxID=1978767 RepID=UPI002E15FFCF|nr:alkaline phosphatase [Telluribacter sp.]
MKYLLYLVTLLLALPLLAQPSAAQPGAAQPNAAQPGVGQPKHVIVIGIDGLSPDGIQKATTPVLDSLMRTGAYSFTAKAVYPSSSSPNWASMITGTSPAHHEIWSNKWKRSDIADLSYCGGAKGQLFPTIFRVLREKMPQATIATFYDWDDFGRLLEDDVCTVKEDRTGEDDTAKRAAAYITDNKPAFTFVHVDHFGHEIGHGTPAYYGAVSKADSLIGQIMNAVRKAGISNETVVIVTADHGGINKGHGGTSPAEMNIPWIISGKGIRKNVQLKQPIDTFDTAVTVAHLFRATTPTCWTGKPVLEAFMGNGR